MPADRPAQTAGPTRGARDYRDRVEALTGVSLRVCPVCHDGQMVAIVLDIAAWPTPTVIDTS